MEVETSQYNQRPNVTAVNYYLASLKFRWRAKDLFEVQSPFQSQIQMEIGTQFMLFQLKGGKEGKWKLRME